MFSELYSEQKYLREKNVFLHNEFYKFKIKKL